MYSYPQATLDERNSDRLDAVAYCQPVSIQRCITNLIDNALAYGGKAKLSLRLDSNELVLLVKDSGPGIPENQIKEMFKPFNRADKSRNRDSGGFGLGLTIARNVAHANAGEIFLKNDPSGGLVAELHLPAWRE